MCLSLSPHRHCVLTGSNWDALFKPAVGPMQIRTYLYIQRHIHILSVIIYVCVAKDRNVNECVHDTQTGASERRKGRSHLEKVFTVWSVVSVKCVCQDGVEAYLLPTGVGVRAKGLKEEGGPFCVSGYCSRSS